MRYPRIAILAGAGALLIAGAAEAATAEFHKMNVALPDGSIAQIEYAGKVAPNVTIEPADPDAIAVVDPVLYDPFVGLDQLTAQMQAEQQAMLQQAAALERAAARAGTASPDGVTLTGDLPKGMHFSYVSSTTDASGCTRTVRYSSDGTEAQPKVTKVSSGTCDGDNAKAAPSATTTVSAPAPVTPQAPGDKV